MHGLHLSVSVIILQQIASQRFGPEANLQNIGWTQPEYQQQQYYDSQDLQRINHEEEPHFQSQPFPMQQNRQRPANLRTFDNWSFDDFKKLLILPGTHWCGVGNNSNSYKDVGSFADVDNCCKAHDHCDHIVPNESRGHLTNPFLFFSISECNCDYVLQRCLKNINTNFSNFVGKIYFDNPFRMQCFAFNYPMRNCTKTVSFLSLYRCIEWTYDETAPRMYAFFPLPLYDSTMHVIQRNNHELRNNDVDQTYN